MGKGTSTTSNTVQNQNVQYTPYGLPNFNSIYDRANQVSQTPYNPYTGELVAGLNGYQFGGINQVMDSAQQAQPYLNQAGQQIQGASGDVQNAYNLAGAGAPWIQNYGLNNIGQGANMIASAQSPLAQGQGLVQQGAGVIDNAQGYLPGAANAVNQGLGMIGQAPGYLGQGANFIGSGAGFAGSGAQGVGSIGANDIQSYMNPYTQNVIGTTLANINQNNALQQQQLQGNAAMQGALGGDRVGVAKAELARQQDLATNQTIAGLQNQNYSQAVQTALSQQQNQQANQARQLQAAGLMGSLGQGYAGLGGLLSNIGQANFGGANTLGGLGATQAGIGSQIAGAGNALVGSAGQQAGIGNLYAGTGLQYGNLAGQNAGIASQMGNLGSLSGNLAGAYGNIGLQAQNAGISGGQSLLGAGTASQQNQQALDTANYQQYLQQLAFPYQQAQFMAGIGLPASGAMGGFQSQIGNANQIITPPGMSVPQGLIGGTALLGGLFGGGWQPSSRGGRIEGFAKGGATEDMYRDIEDALSHGPIPKVDPINMPTSYHPNMSMAPLSTAPQASNQSALGSVAGLAGLANAGKTLGGLFGAGSGTLSAANAAAAGDAVGSSLSTMDAIGAGLLGTGAAEGIGDAAALAGAGAVAGEASGLAAADLAPLLLLKRGGVAGYDEGGAAYPSEQVGGNNPYALSNVRGGIPKMQPIQTPHVYMGEFASIHPPMNIAKAAAATPAITPDQMAKLGQMGSRMMTMETEARGGAIPKYPTGGRVLNEISGLGFDPFNRFPYPPPIPQVFPSPPDTFSRHLGDPIPGTNPGVTPPVVPLTDGVPGILPTETMPGGGGSGGDQSDGPGAGGGSTTAGDLAAAAAATGTPSAPSGKGGFGDLGVFGPDNPEGFNNTAPSVSVNPSDTPGQGLSSIGNPATTPASPGGLTAGQAAALSANVSNSLDIAGQVAAGLATPDQNAPGFFSPPSPPETSVTTMGLTPAANLGNFGVSLTNNGLMSDVVSNTPAGLNVTGVPGLMGTVAAQNSPGLFSSPPNGFMSDLANSLGLLSLSPISFSPSEETPSDIDDVSSNNPAPSAPDISAAEQSNADLSTAAGLDESGSPAGDMGRTMGDTTGSAEAAGAAAAEAGAAAAADAAAGDAGDAGDGGDGGDGGGGDGGGASVRRGGFIRRHYDQGGDVDDDADTFDDRFNAVNDLRLPGGVPLPYPRPAAASVAALPENTEMQANPYATARRGVDIPDRQIQPSWAEIGDVNSPQFNNQGARRQTPAQQLFSPRGLAEFGARVLAADPARGWGSAIGSGALGTMQTFDKQANEDLSTRQHAQKLAAEIKRHVDSYTLKKPHEQAQEDIAHERNRMDQWYPMGLSGSGHPILMNRKSGQVINGITGQPLTEDERIQMTGGRGSNAFQLKQQAWLEAHPGDTQGALQFASGLRQDSNLAIEKMLAAADPTFGFKPIEERAAVVQRWKQMNQNGGQPAGAASAGASKPDVVQNGRLFRWDGTKYEDAGESKP